jgi:hypothetical protein
MMDENLKDGELLSEGKSALEETGFPDDDVKDEDEEDEDAGWVGGHKVGGN